MGANSGKIQIWDSATCRVIRDLEGHESRVGTMAWSSTLLASGSRDRNIYLQDIRIRSSSSGSSNNNANATSNSGSYGTPFGSSLGLSGSRDGFMMSEEYAHSLVTEIALAHTSNQRDGTSGQSGGGGGMGAGSRGFSSPAAVPLSPSVAASAGPQLSLSVVRQLTGHKQEVCGLKWSFDEKMLASG